MRMAGVSSCISRCRVLQIAQLSTGIHSGSHRLAIYSDPLSGTVSIAKISQKQADGWCRSVPKSVPC